MTYSEGSLADAPTARHIIFQFCRYLLPYWYHGLFVLLCVLFVTAVSLAPPYITKIVIDDVLPTGNLDALVMAIGVLVILTAAYLILSFSSYYLYLWTGNHVVRDIRVRLFRHLFSLPMNFHHQQPTGELVFRLNNDVGVIQAVLTSSVLRFIHSIITLSGLVVVLAWMNMSLFLVSIVVIPLFIGNLLYFQPRIRETTESLQDQGAGVSSFTIERFNNVALIQSLNTQDYEAHRFRSALNALIATVMRNGRYSVSMDTISSALVMTTPVVILGWGGYLVMKDVTTLGTLIAFIQYMSRLFGPVQGLHDLYMDLVQGLVSMRRVLEFMQVPTEEAMRGGRQAFSYDRAIEVQDVHFRFGQQPVLQGVKLQLRKGTTYALVGPSGSGKTTLAHLMCGFYQVGQGGILVDGVPLNEIRLSKLREHVGLVGQQVSLFDTTIRENIRYGNFEQEPVEIEEVSQHVGLNNLDLEARVGEQGMQLSGGQQQRIALARTLLRPLELLILDEATSALDAESEEEVLRCVRQRFSDKTILLISHRLSAVQGVDEVICLVGGRIVEQGPPALLLSRQGYYARFVQAQQEAGEVL